MFGFHRRQTPAVVPPPEVHLPTSGFHVDTEWGETVEDADARDLHRVLATAADTGGFFIVIDNADASGMTYLQGFTADRGATWRLEYQGGSLADHWAADAYGTDAERIVQTWMATREWRSTAAWTPDPQ